MFYVPLQAEFDNELRGQSDKIEILTRENGNYAFRYLNLKSNCSDFIG